jgi:hypothetical protein
VATIAKRYSAQVSRLHLCETDIDERGSVPRGYLRDDL